MSDPYSRHTNDVLAHDVSRCAEQSRNETDFLSWLRREHIAYSPVWDRLHDQEDRVVAYYVQDKATGSWVNAADLSPSLRLSELRAMWQQSPSDETNAQVLWRRDDAHPSEPVYRDERPASSGHGGAWIVGTLLAIAALALLGWLIFHHHDDGSSSKVPSPSMSSTATQPSPSTSIPTATAAPFMTSTAPTAPASSSLPTITQTQTITANPTQTPSTVTVTPSTVTAAPSTVTQTVTQTPAATSATSLPTVG